MSEITAVVMAGGKGTRLHPITASIPKPLVPVGEKPILDYVLTWLYRCGIRRVVLAINHLAEIICAVVGDGKRWGLSIEYSIEDKPLGTIGPLRLIKNLPDNFLVLNGDILTNLNLYEFYQYHLAGNSMLTIATTNRRHEVDFGVINYNSKSSIVTSFDEKPTLNYSVSMGIYGMKKELLDFIPEDTPFGLDLLVLKLLKEQKQTKVFPFSGQWLDIGRLEDFTYANSEKAKALLDKIMNIEISARGNIFGGKSRL